MWGFGFSGNGFCRVNSSGEILCNSYAGVDRDGQSHKWLKFLERCLHESVQEAGDLIEDASISFTPLPPEQIYECVKGQ